MGHVPTASGTTSVWCQLTPAPTGSGGRWQATQQVAHLLPQTHHTRLMAAPHIPPAHSRMPLRADGLFSHGGQRDSCLRPHHCRQKCGIHGTTQNGQPNAPMASSNVQRVPKTNQARAARRPNHDVLEDPSAASSVLGGIRDGVVSCAAVKTRFQTTIIAPATGHLVRFQANVRRSTIQMPVQRAQQGPAGSLTAPLKRAGENDVDAHPHCCKFLFHTLKNHNSLGLHGC
jgi:hypothetical protein